MAAFGTLLQGANGLRAPFPRLFPTGASSGPLYGEGWDACTLGGIRVPGLAQLKGGGLALRKDPKKAAGKNGGKPTFHGVDGKDITMSVRMWTDEQLTAWAQLCNDLSPFSGTVKPVSIDAPGMKALPFDAVTITAISPIEFDGQFATSIMTLDPWVDVKQSSKKVTTTPTRKVRNLRAEEAKAKANADGQPRQANNPEPTKQPGAAGPSGKPAQLVETGRFK